MKSVNLSEWAVKHGALVAFFMVLVAVAGLYAYFHLGRDEDPQFTVKTMVVRAYLPGATIEETTLQLTDRIEKKLQETPSLDYLKSYTLAGETTIFVHLLTSTDKKDVPDIWYQVRKKVGDMRTTLPAGVQGPFFNDEFGDTYTNIYAITGEGFGYRELKDFGDRIRSELLRVPGVAKVDFIGEQEEKVFIELSNSKLATLGVEPLQIYQTLSAQNTIAAAGVFDTPTDRIYLRPTGAYASLDAIRDIAAAMATFLARESCGQCAPCRVGTAKMARILAEGPVHFEDGKSLAFAMREASICNLGRNAGVFLERVIDQLRGGCS